MVTNTDYLVHIMFQTIFASFAWMNLAKDTFARTVNLVYCVKISVSRLCQHQWISLSSLRLVASLARQQLAVLTFFQCVFLCDSVHTLTMESVIPAKRRSMYTRLYKVSHEA
jgi:hypothetical protein